MKTYQSPVDRSEIARVQAERREEYAALRAKGAKAFYTDVYLYPEGNKALIELGNPLFNDGARGGSTIAVQATTGSKYLLTLVRSTNERSGVYTMCEVSVIEVLRG